VLGVLDGFDSTGEPPRCQHEYPRRSAPAMKSSITEFHRSRQAEA